MTDKKAHHAVDSKRNSVWSRIYGLNLGVLKNSSVRNKILYGFGIIAFVLSILGAIGITSLTNMRNQFEYVVQHDAKVIENVREISKLVVDMETGQRGFIITGKDEFLEPYNNGVIRLKILFEEEKNLISDNPEQLAALDTIRQLVTAWKNKAGLPEISLARKVHAGELNQGYLADLLAKGEGKKILDNIRAHLDEFIAIEQQLTSVRYQNASNTATFTFVITILLVTLGIVIAIGLGFRVSNSISNPIRHLQNSADMIATGNLDANIKIKSNDEVGDLANSMIIMRDNLKQINQENERQKDKLNRTNKELEQFAYIASHDLQEPLRTVMSFVNLLKEDYQGKPDEDTYKYLQFISQSTKRMSSLIKGLLDYSQLGTEKEVSTIDCGQVLNEIKEDLSARIKETNTTLRVDELPQVRAGYTELRLLFQNLINNAIKFQKKKVQPEINITAKQELNHWKFSVQDNGIGIAPEHVEKIFSIFQRLHNRKEYEGTGIGLAHCQKIVDLLGGKIWVESELDKGCTFYFTIPN
jgi:signal transduction histidine kinase